MHFRKAKNIGVAKVCAAPGRTKKVPPQAKLKKCRPISQKNLHRTSSYSLQADLAEQKFVYIQLLVCLNLIFLRELWVRKVQKEKLAQR